MSTSPSLPAGFFITSINSQRCTAVPRASTTLTGSLATAAAAAAQPPTTTTTPIATTPIAKTPVVDGVNIAGGAVVSSQIASTPIAAVPATTSASLTVTSVAALSISEETTTTGSSSTIIPDAQSEVSASSTASSFTVLNGSSFTSSKATSTSSFMAIVTSTSSASSASTASPSKTSPGPIIGGVLGSMSFIALVAFLFWYFRRREKKGSLLTPLGTGQRSSFYDSGEVITEKGSKWKYELSYQTDRLRYAGAEFKESLAGLGAALKSKVGRDRSDTPSVNLNRGNSQFLDGPIPQHSRNSSAVSSNLGRPTFKERATDVWESVGERVSNFKWSLPRKANGSVNPFASARSMSEKQASMNDTSTFGPLMEISERDLQLQAERRRASLAAGNLRLNFGAEDPFADSTRPAPRTNASTDPFADPWNPFSDTPARPEPSISKGNTYVADIRRSRGQSIDATTTANNASNTASIYRPPSTIIGSRYPSTIAPSRDSYRDTVFSSFSANARKGKGRSDPFDLERPELWRPRANSSEMYPPAPNSTRFAGANAKAQGILGMDVGGQPGKRVSYNSSKYSSGVSALSEWGEPGPDVAPGSLNKESVLGNGMDIYQAQQVGAGGEVRRSTSKASSMGDVGKAM